MTRSGPAAVAAFAVLVLALLAGGLLLAPADGSSRHADPRRTQALFVDPSMPAAQQGPRYARLGDEAQALWLTDGYSAGAVERVARAYARRAVAAAETPVLALYAIPDRDCGGYSAGGLPSAKAYQHWVARVATGLKGTHPIVVLEPDALPFVGACSGQGDRERMLAQATHRLAQAGAWVYLDAGHDGWQPASVMATRLKQAGVAEARGFSLNVANFRPTGTEETYAHQILAQLRSDGVRGAHFVIDTSRNGPPAGRHAVSSEVCNQTWARIGASPKMLFDGAYDGRLWVKNPGESDGTCNGGPPAGKWCDLLADRLLGRKTHGEDC